MTALLVDRWGSRRVRRRLGGGENRAAPLPRLERADGRPSGIGTAASAYVLERAPDRRRGRRHGRIDRVPQPGGPGAGRDPSRRADRRGGVEGTPNSRGRGRPSDEVVELFGPPKRVVVVSGPPLPSGRSVVFVDDISERRRADQVRTDFVANVSHELKHADRRADGAGRDIASMSTSHEVVQRVVGRMLGEAERATGTIDDLLELSRDRGRHRALQVELVRLADVVRDAVGTGHRVRRQP